MVADRRIAPRCGVSNADDALDLAAALVKLSRLLPVAPLRLYVGFVTGSMHPLERLLA